MTFTFIFFNIEFPYYFKSGGYKKMSSILADQQRPRIWAQCGGGAVVGSQPMGTAVHIEPK